MTDDRIDEFADGIIGAMAVGMAMQQQLGPQIIDDLIAIGVTGEVFWEYFKSVDRDYSRVEAGINDGSAAEYVHAFYEQQIRVWAELSAIDDGNNNSKHLLHYVSSYHTIHPDRAEVLAKELDLQMPNGATI
jgi:hypothetical protein